MKLRYPVAQSPFKDGETVYLKTGERGTAYTDGWGNMAYLKPDGIVYLYFLPYRARSLDRVRQLPITDFDGVKL
jgi:hypothetical protein